MVPALKEPIWRHVSKQIILVLGDKFRRDVGTLYVGLA